METTITNAQSLVGVSPVIARTYQIISVLFLVLAVVSFIPALLFFYNGFFGKAVFLVGYTLLNTLFAYGLWKRERWMVTLSIINAVGIFLVKMFGLWKGMVSGSNMLLSILVVAVLVGYIYVTRASLGGKRGTELPILVVYLIVLIPILLRSIGIL